MIPYVPGVLLHVCENCGTSSLERCWICGNEELEDRLLAAPLCPGVLIEDIL